MRSVLAPPPPPGLVPVERPSFSVVVAAYQAADTIGASLASAFEQTVAPFEVVVCDDGSTDDLDAALAPFRDRITFVRQANAGEGSAKNAAVRAASGEFVVVLDADDVFLPGRIEALGELAAARPDLDILTTDAFLELDGRVVRRCYDDTWVFPTTDQRTEILRRNFVFGLAAVRRSRFLASGGFDEALRHATDWDLWCRLVLDGARVGLVAEPLARYRLRADSLSAQRARLLRGRVEVLAKAASRPDLSPDERRVVAESLARERRAATLAASHEALLDGAPELRRLALRVAVARAMPLSSRLKALVAVAAPQTAAGLLRRRLAARGVPGQAGVEHRPSP